MFEHLAGHRLTEAELAIVSMVAEGMTNKEIGQQVYLTENTIKTHLRRIQAKLQVKNRTVIVVRCLELGLIK